MSIKRQITQFIQSHKRHTQAAVSITLVAIDHMIEHRDWTQLARLISSVEPRMGRRMRGIVGQAVGGITMSADTDAEFGLKFKLGDNFGPTDKLADLRKMVDDGASIFSEGMDKFLELEPSKPADYDLSKKAENFAKTGLKNGQGLEAMLNAVRRAYADAAKKAVEKAQA